MKRTCAVMGSVALLWLLAICGPAIQDASAQTQPKGAGTSKTAQAKKAGAPKGDTEIGQCINDRLAASAKLKGQAITVSVTNRAASLIGAVKDQGSKQSAASIAKGCGARTVNNALTIDLGAKPKGTR